MIREKGYLLRYDPTHTRADSRGYVPEHIAIAQAAFGRPLPAGAVVHHANCISDDNRNSNLVICQDNGYHRFLHARIRVKRAGGDPNTQRICSTCRRVLSIVDDFYRRRVDVSRECRHCVGIRVKAHTQRNHAAYLVRQAGYRAARKAAARAR